jgi:hypothetical protein
MDFYELLLVFLLAGGAWLWLDSIKAREIGIQAAQRACAEGDVQFLDETVLWCSLKLVRDDEGRLKLRRIYEFEYSESGNDRRIGSVTMLSHEVEFLQVRPNLYVIPNANHTLH